MSPQCAPPVAAPSASWRATIGAAARLAGQILAFIALSGVVVAVTGPGAARRSLRFPFTGVPATAGEALAIFGHNLRTLAGVLGLLLIAQAPLQAGLRPGTATRIAQVAGEFLISAVIAVNVFVIGMALAGYGPRMVRALLPHGPVELAAYALILALYQQGSHARLDRRHAVGVIAASIALLALAAGLEAFVTP
jgi:hypothetical protein